MKHLSLRNRLRHQIKELTVAAATVSTCINLLLVLLHTDHSAFSLDKRFCF